MIKIFVYDLGWVGQMTVKGTIERLLDENKIRSYEVIAGGSIEASGYAMTGGIDLFVTSDGSAQKLLGAIEQFHSRAKVVALDVTRVMDEAKTREKILPVIQEIQSSRQFA